MIVKVNVYVDPQSITPEAKALGRSAQWSYEVEINPGRSKDDPGPEVIHTEGWFATPQDAIEAGDDWVIQNSMNLFCS